MSYKFAKCVLTLVIGLGLAIAGGYAAAQSSVSGSISGTVTDSSGAVIQGAAVTITNTDRGEDIRALTTNSAGYFTAESLPLGTYTVKIAGTGFKTSAVTGLVLNANDALTVNRSLVPGGASEVVTVTAAEAQLDMQDATSATLIDSTQINEMALITRNYETLLNLEPGVAFGGASDQLNRGPNSPTGGSSTVAFSVNGGRTTSNNWTIDGADNLDRGANLTLYTYPSPDAIAEVKTMRGQYSAAFGRNASGQVDVVTKSGANAIHGSAYEFIRNDYFDADGYYNDLKHIPITKYRYNDFGASFGGPVYIPKIYNGRDKTFFFISEEALREVTYTTGSAIVPTAAERGGDFSNSGFIPSGSTTWTTGPIQVCTAFTYSATTQTSTCTASGTKVTTISPTAQAYLKDIYGAIPAPQSAADLAVNVDPHTLDSTIPNTFNNLNSVVRIDQQAGQKLSVFYRYMHDTFPSFQGSGTFVASPIPGLSATVTHSPGTEQLGHATYLFSPTLLGNIGYAYSNGSILTTPQGALLSSVAKDVNVPEPYPNTVGVVPTISVSGMTTLGGGAVYVDHGVNHQAFGDITKTFHNHTFIAGFSYNHYQKQENSATGGNQGSFGFINDTGYSSVVVQAQLTGVPEAQAFANFLTGNANNGFSQQNRNIQVNVQSDLYEGYFQDNWKYSPRLTLNLGARYSYFGQPFDANGFLSNFDPAKYSASMAPTIASSGLICFTSPCSQTGSNAGLATTANSGADYNGPNYINGLIFGNPSSLNNNQTSPYGNKVGAAGKYNFAPRVGFAFDLFGDGKTALRGGYGWSYDQAEVSYYETTIFDNPPAVATYSNTNAVLDNPAGGATSTTPSTTPGRLQALPLNYQTPYVQQFSLDIQQQITPTFMFDIGYFGDHGTHLLGILEINQPVPGAWMGVVNPTTASSGCTLNGNPAFLNSTCDRVLNQIKPYLGYFAIDTMRSIFNSNYNSLQAKITKRFYGKTYIDANYTWSHDLTNAQADYSGVIQNIYNINGDYGRAAVDRTQVLNVDGVFEEPFFRNQKGLEGHMLGGWELSAIYSANSGLPLTVSASGGSAINYNLPGGVPSVYNNSITGGTVTDNAGLSVLGNTNAGLRPNQIGSPNQGNGIKIHNKNYESSASPWFYTGAFAAPAQNSPLPGNAKRGTIQGPGFSRFDIGVFRNFRIYEGLNFQFRAEAFNAPNHANVQSIGTAATTPSTFGLVTGYRDARILQFAGKFNF